MKRIRHLAVLSLGMLLAGCQSEAYSEEQMKGTSSWNCVQGSTMMQLKNTQDRLEQSIETFLMPYEAVITEQNVSQDEARAKALEMMSGMFRDLEGVEMVCTPQQEGILCILNVDYTRADPKALEQAGLDTMIGLAQGYVSASKTLNTLQKQGFACQAGS